MIAGVFEIPGWLIEKFYEFTSNYAISIALIAVVVMIVITPLTLKSTKGMLEMQRLAPETKRLQQLYRNDRAKLNEEMMALYQEHKVNPMASCLPLLAQMPVFIIMFRVLHGLTYRPTAPATRRSPVGVRRDRHAQPPARLPPPLHLARFELYKSLNGQTQMISFGLDLAKSPGGGTRRELRHGAHLRPARRRARRPLLRPAADGRRPRRRQPADVAQPAEADAVPAGGVRHLPGVLPAGLVIYYMAQAILRIGQQLYITRRFYGHDEALGRQAQRASEQARELAKADGDGGRWRGWRRLLRPGPP